MRSIILLALLTFGIRAVAAEAPLDPGFVLLFNTEYDAAVQRFGEQVALHANDPSAHNNLAQALLYRELFRNGALNSQLITINNPFLRRDKIPIPPKIREQLLGEFDRADGLEQRALQANGNNVRAFYQSAVTYGLRANYYFLVEKAWTTSLREATAARRADERVLELDPRFVDANLILGIYEYVVGSLPFYMKALGVLGGFRGDRDDGLSRLELVAREGESNRYDAKALLAALYRREQKPEKAIPLLKELAERFLENSLFHFEQVQMYGDLGNKRAAISELKTIADLQQGGAFKAVPIPAGKLEYVSGNLHFWFNDLLLAEQNLKEAVTHTATLDRNTLAMANLRLGQTRDLLKRHGEARACYERVLEIAPDTEIASEAKGYISSQYQRKQKNSD